MELSELQGRIIMESHDSIKQDRRIYRWIIVIIITGVLLETRSLIGGETREKAVASRNNLISIVKAVGLVIPIRRLYLFCQVYCLVVTALQASILAGFPLDTAVMTSVFSLPDDTVSSGVTRTYIPLVAPRPSIPLDQPAPVT